MTEQTIGQAHSSRISRQAQARRQAAAARARRAHERAVAAQERARALREGLEDSGERETAVAGAADVQRAADRARQATIDLDEARSSSAAAHRDAAALHDAAARQASAGGPAGATPGSDVELQVHAQRSRQHLASAEHDEELARG